MTAAVKIQPQGFSVQYPKTQWRVSFVEDTAGKFRFLLRGQNFKFEPRDRLCRASPEAIAIVTQIMTQLDVLPIVFWNCSNVWNALE